MRRMLFVATLLGAGLAAQPAHADPYRWCAEYAGGRGGSSNCYFMAIQRCQAAVSGNGGFCRPNGFYTGDGRAEPDSRRRH